MLMFTYYIFYLHPELVTALAMNQKGSACTFLIRLRNV